MNEIIKGVSFQEYYLTLVRMCTFLNYLGVEHKKKTPVGRLVLYDFYLKYPELFIESNDRLDFDTKYSYFHWKPNYRLYTAVLADLRARGLVIYSEYSKDYFISERGSKYASEVINSYTRAILDSSIYIEKNICKLSLKQISENIDDALMRERENIE